VRSRADHEAVGRTLLLRPLMTSFAYREAKLSLNGAWRARRTPHRPSIRSIAWWWSVSQMAHWRPSAPREGGAKWSHKTRGAITASPLVINSSVYVGNMNSKVLDVNEFSGQFK
jgi:hypothetical protein